MAIEKMKRLKLVAVKSDREALFKELITLECVQLSEPEEEPADSSKARSFLRETAGLTECKSDYEVLVQGIELLNKYVQERVGLFKHKPVVSKQTVLDDSSLRDSVELSNNIRSNNEQIERISFEESRIKGLIETFKPWSSLDIPFGLTETETCILVPGIVPASVKLISIENELSSEESESQIIKVLSDKEKHCILLVAMKENRDSVFEIVQKYGFVPLSTGNMTGTAAENISDLKKSLTEFEAEKKEITAAICAMAASRNELKLCADRLLTNTEKAENEERLLCTEYTINFEGFFPASEEKKLVSVLSGFDCAWEITEPTAEDMVVVPFMLGRGPFSGLKKRKLCRAGRKPFRPLKIKTCYVNVI